jgi:dephospho-CoA kinase
MPVVGLTGGIASGKSTVAFLLGRRGAIVIDADAIARRLVEPGMPALVEIRKRFGPEFVRADGALDRKRLGELVFAHAEARRELNSLLHPLIFEGIRERLATTDASRVRIVEAALLVESAPWETGQLDLDALIVVASPPELQKQRLAAERGMSEADAAARMAAQVDTERRTAAADYVIDNRGSLAELEQEVDRVWQQLLSRFDPSGRGAVTPES